MNVSLPNIPSVADVKAYYADNRERIMIWFLVIATVFFLFYWTSLGINAAIQSRRETAVAAREETIRASELAAAIKAKGNTKTTVQGGVLSFVQEATASLGMSGKVASLKPVPRPTGQEAVSVRIEGITLTELVSLTRHIGRFSNLAVLNFSLTRRFDNPELADATFEIMKR